MVYWRNRFIFPPVQSYIFLIIFFFFIPSLVFAYYFHAILHRDFLSIFNWLFPLTIGSKNISIHANNMCDALVDNIVSKLWGCACTELYRILIYEWSITFSRIGNIFPRSKTCVILNSFYSFSYIYTFILLHLYIYFSCVKWKIVYSIS